FLDDRLPDMAEVGKDYVCAFENITDLKPQVRQFLEPKKTGNLYIFHDDRDALFRMFCQCFTNISAAGGLVRNEKEQVLVIFRRGKWDLPKGKAEDGETIEQTALREVEEESGLQGVEIRKFLTSTFHIYTGTKDFILKKTDWYAMHYPGKAKPRPLAKEDITEAKWINPSSLDEIYNNTYLSIMEVFKETF
ncbi:NUDIX hydrolase, partial [Bacteroidota bacterium]